MKNLTTAQRLMGHLDTKGKEYYKEIIAKTNRVLSEEKLQKNGQILIKNR